SKSVEFYLESLELREQLGDKKDIAATLNNIGNVYKNLSSFLKALEFYEKSLDIRKSIGDKVLIAYTLNDIGGIYWSMKQYDKALKYYQEALKIRNETGDKAHIASSLKNIGIVYKDMDNFDSALTNYQRGIELYKELKDNINTTSVLNYMGNLYRKNGDFSVALNYYSQAYDISYDDNYYEGMAYTLLNIGELYNDRKNKQKAIQHFENALKLAEKLEDKELIRSIYKDLSAAYSTTSDFIKAYEYYKMYSDFMDELYAEESSKKIAEMQSRYETEKKEKELELMEKVKQLEIDKKMEEVAKQKRFIYILTAGLFILLLFSSVLYRNYLQKKKANALLAKQKEELEKQSKLLLEANSTLETKNRTITDSISYAKRIQDAILPSGEMLKSTFIDYFIFFKPKDIVSGDFYWLYKIKELTFFALADCTGHGVPGAFMSIIGSSLLDEIVKEKKVLNPAKILYELNFAVLHALNHGNTGENIHTDGMDITLCCYNEIDNELTVVLANHFAILFKNNNVHEINGDVFSIGEIARDVPDFNFTKHSYKIEKNNILYLFSDGFVDQFGGPDNKKFMKANFRNLIAGISSKPLNEQEKILEKTFLEWKGNNKQLDDVLLMGIKLV
ncbi:MAG: tetratricopeptide repeat protein, partial [Bacteroidia bacterium]|nr:tetratricopeptide repeat protein [Bacteroidia bacterium]